MNEKHNIWFKDIKDDNLDQYYNENFNNIIQDIRISLFTFPFKNF